MQCELVLRWCAGWTKVVMGSNPGRVKKLLFQAAAMLLTYTVQRTAVPKLCLFKDLLPQVIVLPHRPIIWRYCRPNLTSLFVRHVTKTNVAN
jgi:hypothetical protein